MSYEKNIYNVNPLLTERIELPNLAPTFDFLYTARVYGHEYLESTYYIERSDIDIYMINYVVGGSGFIEYKGKHFSINQGDLTFLYLGEHNVLFPLTDQLELYFFHIKGSDIHRFFSQITVDDNFVVRGIPLSSVQSLYSSLRKLDDDPNPIKSSQLIYSFLTEILQNSIKKRQLTMVAPLVTKIITTVRAILPTRELSVQSIANYLNYHPVYLEQYFKKETGGKTLTQLIHETKCNRASFLLLNTNKTLTEIADELGYSDANGLILLFKRLKNCTPLQYRKKHQHYRT